MFSWLRSSALKRFQLRYGWIADSFGHYVWSRSKLGQYTPTTVILTEDEFWGFVKAATPDDLTISIERAGGPTADGSPRAPFAISSPATAHAREQIYRAAAMAITEQMDLGNHFLAARKSADFDALEDKRSWLVALDVFGLCRPDFRFERLDYPFSGVVLSLEHNSKSAPTTFDGRRGIAVRFEDLVRVSGRGVSWSIELSNGEAVILDHEAGLAYGKMTPPT